MRTRRILIQRQSCSKWKRYLYSVYTVHWKLYCTVLCILYTVHCTLHFEQSKQYTFRRTMYIVQYKPCIVQSRLITVHCLLFTVLCTIYNVQSTQNTVHCPLYGVHFIHFLMCTVCCILYNVQYKLLCVHCTQYTVICMMYTLHWTVHWTLSTVHFKLYTQHNQRKGGSFKKFTYCF